MIEIKTTEEIRKPLENNRNYKLAEVYWKKKWIAFDDLIKLIEKLKERFGVRPLKEEGEEQDRFISYIQLKNELNQLDNKK